MGHSETYKILQVLSVYDPILLCIWAKFSWKEPEGNLIWKEPEGNLIWKEPEGNLIEMLFMLTCIQKFNFFLPVEL